MTAIDQSQIQGIVFTGYPDLPFATYLVLAVSDRGRASAWLQGLLPFITDGRKQTRATAVNVAFSHAGLAALGLPEGSLESFPREFSEGMAGSEARSRILGDTGPSAPERWIWGAPAGAGASAAGDVHVFLMLYAGRQDHLERLELGQRAAFEGAARVVFRRDSVTLADQKEHFGFVDGISQPRIEGSETTRKEGLTFVKPGEFILGHCNEYDQVPLSPTVASGPLAREHLPAVGDQGDDIQRDLGANGSYLVVRQLAQDVQGFWATMYQQGGAEDGVRTEDKAVRLAAKCVGRWPGGAPMTLSPHRDHKPLARENGFSYQDDLEGMRCPVGAHIRRANPRDSLAPGPVESAKLTRRHMIMRRGRAYGPPLAPFQGEERPQERGLFFIAVNANIGRQFEFMQQTWLNNPKFDGLSDETDPINGARDPKLGGTFSIPEQPARRRLTGLPSFVTTRGGEYFFLPGLAALRYLADLGARLPAL